MGLTTALNAAVSGLRTTQAGMDLVASNVANANSIGYSRRTLAPVQALAGERTSGVRTGAIERVLDTIVQKQLRLETAGASYTSTMARFAAEVDRLFGQPGSVGALDTSLNDFTQALQGLAADPAAFSARSAAINAGSVLASHIATIAGGVQMLRSEAEGRIATAVGRANDLLKGIAALDTDIISSPSTPAPPGLLDERDRLITELSQLMDVHVMAGRNGSVTLTTTGGLTLFNGGAPVVLSFDGRGRLAHEAMYSPVDAERGVGTIKATPLGGPAVDVVAGDLIRSGEIGAALELRDTTLVEVQRQLDELAAGLSRALSDRQVSGTAATVGAQTGLQVAGWQPGNAITLDYRDNTAGVQRRLILLPANGSPAQFPASGADPTATVLRVDMSGTFSAAATAIQAALAGRGITVATAAGNTLQFLDDGAPNTTDVTGLSADITATQFDSGFPQLPFFVDTGQGNVPFTGSRFTGLAQRLGVNRDLGLSRAAGLVLLSSTTAQGDATRPLFLVDALTKATRAFPSPSSTGGPESAYVTTVADFTRRLVETQGAKAEAAQRLDEGQGIALAAIEARHAEKSGVNVDQEMAQLVQLQTAYGANARVMTAIRDMMDLLMRM